ncbi:Z1 domain-containing protein [Emcibacteraceae bacterium]|nr:Z1 domain-containing protein [Emcibacteraceae bacterium]
MSLKANLKLITIALIEEAKHQNGGKVTSEILDESIKRAMDLFSNSSDVVSSDELMAHFEREYYTHVNEVLTLQSDEDQWEPWLKKCKADIPWKFWERYRTYLLQKDGFNQPIVDAIDETTDEILENLIDPKVLGAWDRRGMVNGAVQAGKTTNYAGLICKAADAGYKVIIVLTGFHSNLRTQTQIRLEEAFVGYNKIADESEGARVPVGVGRVSSDPSLRVDTITNRSENGDFNLSVARNFGINPGGKPLIFVIKKNASILKNLIKYLNQVHHDKDDKGNYYINGAPLLLIDDEADQGSVDTKKMEFDTEEIPDPDHDPSTLNKLIRKILFIFTQSAYVGYTATPFANIFIHNSASTEKFGDDLFPRSFITTMPTPSNYIGPETVFGLNDDNDDGEKSQPGLPIVTEIDDYAKTDDLKEPSGWMPPKHNKYHVPLFSGENEVPPSLRRAMIAFVIGCSVRNVRGQIGSHNSMLIHVTRFIDVQERVFDQVKSLMTDMKQILLYGEEGSKKELFNEFEELWNSDFLPTNEKLHNEPSNKKIKIDLCPAHTWEIVSRKIVTSTQSIDVRRINGTAGDVLNYEDHKRTGLNVIAIGGDKLSRGLTLEGLTVSYFTRPTKMYDTLMQMGRWFGYRDGFIDVCRLYAPEKLVNWFSHITEASNQLKREFVLMSEMGETPATYGQRVKSHPVLMVTSAVKMRNSMELTCSYSGAISETIVYSRNKAVVENNYATTDHLISDIKKYATLHYCPLRVGRNKVSKGKFMWTGVNVEDVLEFLKSYSTPSHVRRVNTSLLAQYIEKQIKNNDLIEWSVLIAGKDPDVGRNQIISGFSTGLLVRSNHPAYSEKPHEEPSVYRIRRLVSPTDEAWDLSDQQFRDALNLTATNRSTRPGGEEIRVSREKQKALLIIYPLENQEWTAPNEVTDKCYIGFAVSFPGIKNDIPVKYRVNQVYQEHMDD